MLNFKRYIIIAGNYGSGKTEISLNLVRRFNAEGKKTALIDMDIVNPYFRSSEHEKELTEKGIRVIKPCYANTSVDVPSLPPDIYAPFDEKTDAAVFDAGGDPVGAAALGLLKDKLDAAGDDFEFLYVINPRRPLQGNADEIIEMLRLIELNSRQKVTGLIANPNLALQTDKEVITEGLSIVAEVSEKTGIPIRFVSVMDTLKDDIQGEIQGNELLPISLSMRPDWLDTTQ